MDPIPTTVPVVLDKPDDWWAWSAYIKELAGWKDVWKYIDPDDETITIEKPVKPTKPIPSKPFDQMDSTDQFVWQEECREYDWAYRKYEEERNGMMTIWMVIQSSVSPKHRHILIQTISERQRMIKLRDKLKPNKRERAANLRARFHRLGAKKRHDSMEKWLTEWEIVIGECEDAKLTECTGYWAADKFIDAIEPLLPTYAEMRRAELNMNTSVFDEIYAFRRRWESNFTS